MRSSSSQFHHIHTNYEREGQKTWRLLSLWATIVRCSDHQGFIAPHVFDAHPLKFGGVMENLYEWENIVNDLGILSRSSMYYSCKESSDFDSYGKANVLAMEGNNDANGLKVGWEEMSVIEVRRKGLNASNGSLCNIDQDGSAQTDLQVKCEISDFDCSWNYTPIGAGVFPLITSTTNHALLSSQMLVFTINWAWNSTSQLTYLCHALSHQLFIIAHYRP